MRIVSYGAACSLDGFIAGEDGSIDWLHFSKDVQDIMGPYWKSVDLMVMGRRTWDVSVAMRGGSSGKKKEAPPKRANEKITAQRMRVLELRRALVPRAYGQPVLSYFVRQDFSIANHYVSRGRM